MLGTSPADASDRGGRGSHCKTAALFPIREGVSTEVALSWVRLWAWMRCPWRAQDDTVSAAGPGCHSFTISSTEQARCTRERERDRDVHTQDSTGFGQKHGDGNKSHRKVLIVGLQCCFSFASTKAQDSRPRKQVTKT